MSISNALNNATLGLFATSRLAETVADNVANAMTPGFGRRVTELSSLGLGGTTGGVQVVTTYRTDSPQMTAERRAMDAALAATGAAASTYESMLDALGEPGSSGSLVARATAVETALLSAVNEPQSLSRLSEAVSAAKALASKVSSIAQENVRLRSDANTEIGRQVSQLNDALYEIQDINKKISELSIGGQDINSLIDERDRMIDKISSIVPLRAVNRNLSEVALYTANGGMLLDGRVYELKFEPGPSRVTPDMILGSPLSGLSQDQGGPDPVTIRTGNGAGMMDGGSLGALFEIRDTIVPGFDAEMDAYANDLIARFSDPDVLPDEALDADGMGIFVDSAPDTIPSGVAGRLKLNQLVDPAQLDAFGQAGQVTRLRDGLSAGAAVNAGSGATIQTLVDAMTASRAPEGFETQTSANSNAIFASEITSFFAGKSARSDDSRAYLTSRQSALADSESNLIGVNRDNELQSLLVIEQAYAANARVLSAIDALLKQLMEI